MAEGRIQNAKVERAVEAAREAFQYWAPTSIEYRIERLNQYAQALKAQKAKLTEIISQETGKPLWESNTEVDAMINKVGLSIEAQRKLRGEETKPAGDGKAITRYKPHGVAAVLGPFNMPGHLPNGHIVPALLAGNTVVFKPSEMAPLVGQITAECWQAAALPPGVINMVQGGREVGQALAGHPGIDGLFFTGSF